MRLLKIIYRNTLRHWLRTSLTVFGLAIAVVAFIVIRTTIDAWYAQSEAASPDRLVTRHAVSLTFFLPLAYASRIEDVDGVNMVSHASWFGGIYVEPKNFFANFAVDHTTYLDLYPEFQLSDEERTAFMSERNAAVVGRKLADRFGWQVGDRVQLQGTIFPGDWELVIRGIYTGARENTDESSMLFRWDFVDERMRSESPGRAGYVGTFIERIDDPSRAADISSKIDALFLNSIAETKTETEEAFNLSFVAMAGSIVLGLKAISILVIGIILLVLGNTMAMTARERVSEYAVMKTLGFRPIHIVGLIFGESLFIAAIGGGLGILLAFPLGALVQIALSAFFPVYNIAVVTVLLASLAAFVVGLLAAVFPAIKAVRTPIVDGLRIVD
ncbi:MAG: ABC transporter permease [candidate division Zixibacteria bacterium]|jgi:putative ABC transport system permease protein|nr:ABC transporter permease [candidate division Zixibacteria bacterium]